MALCWFPSVKDSIYNSTCHLSSGLTVRGWLSTAGVCRWCICPNQGSLGSFRGQSPVGKGLWIEGGVADGGRKCARWLRFFPELNKKQWRIRSHNHNRTSQIALGATLVSNRESAELLQVWQQALLQHFNNLAVKRRVWISEDLSLIKSGPNLWIVAKKYDPLPWQPNLDRNS